MNQEEVWLPVVGYSDYYEVSDKGFVRSVDRVIIFKNGNTRNYKGTDLKPYIRKRDGRRFVNLKVMGCGDKRTISGLVAEAFLGKRPEGCYVCHRNDDLSDDSLGNLYYGSPKENAADAKRNGKLDYVRGERHGMCRISEDDIDKIISMKDDFYQWEIASVFGISQGHVSAIIHQRKR